MAGPQKYDGGSKWLLKHHGPTIALLGGIDDVISSRATQPEMVQQKQIPDGLLELKRRGRKEPTWLLVEFCTTPESRTPKQIADDIMLVLQERGTLPEVLALVLRRKGRLEVPRTYSVQSEMGTTRAVLEWHTQPLWELDAEELLQRGGVGIVPWTVLMNQPGPPEPFLRRCRERIEREGGEQRPDLLMISQTFVKLRFDLPELLALFGGSQAMIESPLIQGIVEDTEREACRKCIAAAIRARKFAPLDDDARARLQGVKEEAVLEGLHDLAVSCPTREAFMARLIELTTPAPKPVSTRRKRKSSE